MKKAYLLSLLLGFIIPYLAFANPNNEQKMTWGTFFTKENFKKIIQSPETRKAVLISTGLGCAHGIFVLNFMKWAAKSSLITKKLPEKAVTIINKTLSNRHAQRLFCLKHTLQGSVEGAALYMTHSFNKGKEDGTLKTFGIGSLMYSSLHILPTPDSLIMALAMIKIMRWDRHNPVEKELYQFTINRAKKLKTNIANFSSSDYHHRKPIHPQH
jgi:hypothetical protein